MFTDDEEPVYRVLDERAVKDFVESLPDLPFLAGAALIVVAMVIFMVVAESIIVRSNRVRGRTARRA